MDQTNDLTLWPILRKIPNDYLLITDRFYIFNNGESLLLFCRNGKIYGYGNNIYGMLGVPPSPSSTLTNQIYEKYFGLFCCHSSFNGCSSTFVSQPRELTKLRFVNIIAIAKGDKHIMALTEMGDLYGWGANHSGQLGIGWYRWGCSQPTLILQDVQKVCCGPKHTVALAMDGTIRIWGKFPGCPHNFRPERLIRSPSSMIDLISTKYLTVAYNNCIDEYNKGAFYVWGDLKHVGLSDALSTVRLTYKRNDYSSKIFKIIPIGFNKILILTYDGNVSILAIQNGRVRSIRNAFRSINNNSNISIDFCIDVPEDLNVGIMRTSDHAHSNGLCFIWDDDHHRCHSNRLIPTKCSSIADATCLYSSAFTPQLTRLPSKLLIDLNTISCKGNHDNANRFNDPRESDLIFRFKYYHFKPIYVHQSILREYSEYFEWRLSKSNNNDKRNNRNTLTIIIDDNRSYISMFIYLKYIYTKKIFFDQLDDTVISELYNIASKYHDQHFKQKIVDHLYHLI